MDFRLRVPYARLGGRPGPDVPRLRCYLLAMGYEMIEEEPTDAEKLLLVMLTFLVALGISVFLGWLVVR